MDRTELLKHALVGLNHQRTLIEQKITEIGNELTGQHLQKNTATLPAKKKHKMSVAARKRIGDAQRARWAEHNKKKAAK